MDECRLVDFSQHDQSAVGWPHNEAGSPFAHALGIAEEIRDPQCDNGDDYGQEPEGPGATSEGQRKRGCRGDSGDADEEIPLAREIQSYEPV